MVGAVGLLLVGGTAGCTNPVRGGGPPSRVPVYGRNEQEARVGLEHWVSTTASDPDDGDRSNLAWLDAGEERRLVEVPVGDIGITADLLHRDDQRNVLLQVSPDSDAFSAHGYVITVLSNPVRGVGEPGEPVVGESTPGDEAVVGDYIRIAPRPADGSDAA